MGGISSISLALSGLQAAQAGLYVTGHNISNSGINGYTRQQAMQVDFSSQIIGYNSTNAMQVGLGTDMNAIRQIRDTYLDKPYREAMTKLGFYDVKYEAGLEIETVFSELEGPYKLQSVLTDLWNAMQELEGNPTALETRANFIESSVVFTDKFNQAYNDLYNYQVNLNNQITSKIQRVNQLVSEIDKLSMKISSEEASGANANDYRDSRNVALDELSSLIDIEYKETSRGVDIWCEGKELLVQGAISKLGLRYTSREWGFVEPVFTTSTNILGFSEDVQTLFNFTTTNPRLEPRPVNSANGNDNGSLKALMVARGMSPANYTQTLEQVRPTKPDATNTTLYPGGANDPQYQIDKRDYDYKIFNMESALIPRIQMELDTLFHKTVTLINDAISPPYDIVSTPPASYPAAGYNPGDKIITRVPLLDSNGGITVPAQSVWGIVDATTGNFEEYVPFALDVANFDQPFLEIFSRKTSMYAARYDASGNVVAEDPSQYYSLYTLGNVRVNPAFNNTQGYTKIAVAKTPEVHSKTVMEEVLNKWGGTDTSWGIAIDNDAPRNVQDFYKWIVTDLGIEIAESGSFVQAQLILAQQADYSRQAIMGTSLDEEMKNMMIYQHAYNAASRVANVIDGMCDRIINHTGHVGLA